MAPMYIAASSEMIRMQHNNSMRVMPQRRFGNFFMDVKTLVRARQLRRENVCRQGEKLLRNAQEDFVGDGVESLLELAGSRGKHGIAIVTGRHETRQG